MPVTIRPLAGAQLRNAVCDLAALRMTVFADWPYLYDGDAAYEEGYLAEFIAAPGSVLAAALDAHFRHFLAMKIKRARLQR